MHLLSFIKAVPYKMQKGWGCHLWLFLQGSLEEVARPCSLCLAFQGVPFSNALTLYQQCMQCKCQAVHSDTVKEDVWNHVRWGPVFLILTWLSSYPGHAEDCCLEGGLLGSLEYFYCVSSRWESWDLLGGKMEIMALYCIPFIMSCLYARCFIAILLHSRKILVCKFYVFSLICNRYDIKINEFMFLTYR